MLNKYIYEYLCTCLNAFTFPYQKYVKTHKQIPTNESLLNTARTFNLCSKTSRCTVFDMYFSAKKGIGVFAILLMTWCQITLINNRLFGF